MSQMKNARATERQLEQIKPAAQTNIAGGHNSQPGRIRPVPKKHRARVFMLRSGAGGFTENDILRHCHLSSGRNYATELERLLDIQLERIDEPNADGIGSHYRYRFAKRDDIFRVIRLLNNNADINGHQPLTQQEINHILSLYPDYAAS
ncbi:hypothetical protein [Pectobacterium odoriferum]|uniref:hypothetical protein n=1 Tax=Pectobacterium odoriferum TaxID=78398 RepID=UPI00052AF47A|nr:hypothetical protein [Pectobacterium odoriferum]AIU88103.1 hypothetical protein BCS7_08115 [Pectobacterium odoriferum]POE20229.1 hypothetical protein BV918_00740 [Pectobacterium odoriferum]POE36949.1 hypothetical protein BV922_00740 [Pectobacterium odoriferum]